MKINHITFQEIHQINLLNPLPTNMILSLQENTSNSYHYVTCERMKDITEPRQPFQKTVPIYLYDDAETNSNDTNGIIPHNQSLATLKKPLKKSHKKSIIELLQDRDISFHTLLVTLQWYNFTLNGMIKLSLNGMVF